MIDFLAFLFATGVGFGLSCWIFGTILDKSNNIGDSKGDKGYYKAYASFSTRRDRISNSEKDTFCSMYKKIIDEPSGGPSGSSLVRRLTKEELEKYKKAAPENAEKKRPGKPAGIEDEFDLWSSKNPETKMTGIFKPLEDE